MTNSHIQPLFLQSTVGRIFAIVYRAAEPTRCAVFVPPFAEEMNLCRRQVMETARLLANQGCSAVIMDLYGTGDSEGDFSDATWSCWKEDIASVIRWAGSNIHTVDTIVATRLGCALASESLEDAGLSVSKTVFWQPIESGIEHISEFLRIRAASSNWRPGSNESVEGLQQRLDSGETLEIAGYPLTRRLFSELRRIKTSRHIGSHLGDLLILEVGDGEPSTTCTIILAAAEKRRDRCRARRIAGRAYWRSAEVVVVADLCSQTARYITE